MYNESVKSNNPSTEKDTRCKVHSYKVFKSKYFNFTTLMVCLEVKKRRGSRVEGGRVIQLPCLEVF